MRFCTRNAGPACLAAALLLPELVGQPPSAVPRPRNLLLITLDTMRADRLPAYGFPSVHTPALDRIATEGYVFDETYAAVALPSHASMFTGIYPPRLGVRDNAGAPLPTTFTTLAEVLRGRQLQTAAFVSHRRCWSPGADCNMDTICTVPVNRWPVTARRQPAAAPARWSTRHYPGHLRGDRVARSRRC